VLPTVRAGYALVIAYLRGRYDSEGKYDVTAPQDVEGIPALQTIYHLTGHTSFIDLLVIPT
jgi:hypothetical protein